MKIAIAALLIALALMVGCDDDDDCINCPGGTGATIQNIWPNADLTSWTYDYQLREWEGNYTTYPTLEQVLTTPLPSWKEIFDLCEAHEPKTPFAITDEVYFLQFDGTITTNPGVTAQNLTFTLTPAGQSVGEAATTGFSPLLRRLCEARPDLREKMLSPQGEIPEAPGQIERYPSLVHGGAWEKTLTYIGTYGIRIGSTRPSWKFLTNKLYVGSTFSYQLLPTIAPDLVLHCRVYRSTTVTTPAGTFSKALDCLYTIDYGVTTVTDVYGDPIGYMRSFDYGRVIYVPEIGPVYSYEKWGVEPGNPPSDGFLDITIDLTASSTLDQ